MRKIRLLHISGDQKFYDVTFDSYEREGHFRNEGIILVPSPEYVCKYIQRTENTVSFWNKKQFKDRLERDDYDAVLFYSLPPARWWIVDLIPKGRIVIWWIWGYDVYDEYRGLPSRVAVPFYKGKTQAVLNILDGGLKRQVSDLIKRSFFVPFLKRRCMEVFSRIDYAQPVLHDEYVALKSARGFQAKEFYNLDSIYEVSVPERRLPANGSVLLGNSATYTNNHLDVADLLTQRGVTGCRFIVPLNYGRPEYAVYLSDHLQIRGNEVVLLKDFLPKEEYFRIVDSCSYAIFGVLRQQAMGNIYYCLSKGVKVFLYKDSIPYKYLTEMGYCVYALDDVTPASFSSSLTEEECEANLIANKRDIAFRDGKRADAILEIEARLNKDF